MAGFVFVDAEMWRVYIENINNETKRYSKMDNALIGAVKAYAEMAGMTECEVLEAIQAGNESVRNSVAMLLFSVA